MNKKRAALLKAYGRLYRLHKGCPSAECFYCGDPSESMDHRPPLSVVDDVGTKTLRRLRVPLVMIPCCQSCNSILGSRRLATVDESLDYLAIRLEKEYVRITALWSNEEIAELGPNLQTMVRAHMHEKVHIQVRISMAQRRSMMIETWPVFSSWDDAIGED